MSAVVKPPTREQLQQQVAWLEELQTLLAHQQAAVGEEAHMNDSLRREIERLRDALRKIATMQGTLDARPASIALAALEHKP